MATINHWHAALAEHHADHPQRAMRAKMALDSVHAGLQELASLGHNFHLEEGPAAVPREFPKVKYHVSDKPRTVYHESEEAELGPDWYDHPDDAMQAAGEATQFAGRGGVQVSRLVPAPLPNAPASAATQRDLDDEGA